jgi:hypothetical protein
MFCKQAKEITLTYSKQVSSSNTPTPKIALVLHIVFYTILEKTLDYP